MTSDSNFYNEYLEAQRLKHGLVDLPDVATDQDTVTLADQYEKLAERVPQEDVGDMEVRNKKWYENEETNIGFEYGNSKDDGIVTSLAKGVVNGGIKAGESMSALMAEGFNLPIKAYEKVTGNETNFRFKAPKPAVFETNTVGDVTRGVTQFGLQYYTGGNILKAAKWAKSGKKLNDFARAATQGVYADFTAFKGDEERLSNMLREIDQPEATRAIFDYLAADADDGEIEGRLKNVVEGGAMGMAIELVFRMARGIKAGKRALMAGNKKAAQEAMDNSKKEVAEVLDRNQGKIAESIGELPPARDAKLEFDVLEDTRVYGEQEPATVISMRANGEEEYAMNIYNGTIRDSADGFKSGEYDEASEFMLVDHVERLDETVDGSLVDELYLKAAKEAKKQGKTLLVGVDASETAARRLREMADNGYLKETGMTSKVRMTGEEIPIYQVKSRRPPRNATVTMKKPAVNKAEELSEAISAEDALRIKDKMVKFKDMDVGERLRLMSDELPSGLRIDKISDESDVRAFMNLVGETNPPKFKSWDHATQLRMASNYGMEVDELRNLYELGAVNEQALLSSEILLKEQAEIITDLIGQNVDDTIIAAEVAQYDELLKMFASFKNISGRTLDANRIKMDIKRKNIESAQDFIMSKFGGDKSFQKFKEAWVATEQDLALKRGLLEIPVHKKISDSVLEFWKNSILSGVKTMTVNTLGSGINLYKEIGQRFFQGAAGATRSAIRGGSVPERVYMGESLAMLYAQMDGFMDLMSTIGRVAKNPKHLKDFQLPKYGDKAETGYIRKISADYWGIGKSPSAMARTIEKMSGIPSMKTQAAMRWSVDKLGDVINIPGNLMGVQDGIAKNSAARAQRYALAYRQVMEEGADPVTAMRSLKKKMLDPDFDAQIQEPLDEFARRITFQSDLGDWGRKTQQWVKAARPLNIPVGEYVFPFIRTPINIFNQGVTEVNPLFAPASKQFRQALKKGGVEADEAMGRLTFGATLSAIAATATINGVMTGSGPSDRYQREVLYRTGWRPYSIRVPQGKDANGVEQYKYYSYGRLEPVAYVIGSIATLMETVHYNDTENPFNPKEYADLASAYVGAIAEATLDKSFFQGVSNLVGALQDPTRYYDSYQNRLASSFIPNIFRDIGTMIEETPYLRDIRSLEDAINNKIPTRKGQVAVKRNRWGDPIHLDSGWFLGENKMGYFSPVGMSDNYIEPIDAEIKRLAIDGVETPEGRFNFREALVNMPNRYIRRKGLSLKLDTFQYSRFLEIAGKEIKLDNLGTGKEMTLRETLNYLVTEDPLYKTASPIRQAKMIDEASKKFDTLARDQLISEYPELQKELQRAERLDKMSKEGLAQPEDRYQLLKDLKNGR